MADVEEEIRPGPESEPGTGDRARDAVEHLQRAAREMIAAARAALDVADDLVDDPEAMASALHAVGGLGDLLRDRVGVTAPARAPRDAEPRSAGAPAGRPAGDRRPRVQRIRVS